MIDIGAHGAEFAEIERLGVFAGTLLGEENGRAGGDTDGGSYKYG